MNRLKYILGTGLGSGLFPVAPGTAASALILVPLYIFLLNGWPEAVWATAIISSLITLWVSPDFEEHHSKDPALLVSDEWAGQSVALSAVSFGADLGWNIMILLSAFIFFRFFDILKLLGIKKLQNLSGGAGILADDILAGFYALICLKTLIFVWPKITGLV